MDGAVLSGNVSGGACSVSASADTTHNWSSFDSSRKVLLRSPVLVNDPTGSKYQATDLRSFVQQNQ